MKLNRFKVGDAVHVKAVIVRIREGALNRAKVTWRRSPRNKVGVIVGASRRYDGQRDPGGTWGPSPFSDEPPDVEPPSLTATKTHMVWKVRFGLTNKPVDVLDADVEPYEGEFDLPIQEGAWKWNERDRKMMRDEMASWPRDESGRWIKKGGKR